MDREFDFEGAIGELDTRLFRHIESQTTDDDRRSLLAIQRAVRKKGAYVYLEIGSHLGGTIQPHLMDPLCTKIYSIDPRPLIVDDERGQEQRYVDNSTEKMIRLLSEVAPEQMHKLTPIDSSAAEIDLGTIFPKPDLCFIDGEHTNKAVAADFDFCIKVTAPNGAIAFHDSDLVYKGIRKILTGMQTAGVRYQALKLGGSVFAIALGDSPLTTDPYVRSISKSVRYHFLRSAVRLKINRHKIKRRTKKGPAGTKI